jgi:prolyl oligopeptidase
MFIVHRKDVLLDGSNPTLMTGYGGFAAAMRPHYSPQAALWVEYGGVFVSTNLRGGGEFGEEWHQAGILASKQNTFDDFIAAAQWLIDNGYTTPEKLAIIGASNGGLLVGAALTQRPDLFRAVVCEYPLLDMLRYINHPMTKFSISEYGTPEVREQFEYLYAYSPYHNVAADVDYPAAFFVTGDKDTRVDPYHARKMTALMQAAAGSQSPVLLRYDTTLGHSGARAVSMQIDEWVDEFSFLFWQLDIAPERTFE